MVRQPRPFICSYYVADFISRMNSRHSSAATNPTDRAAPESAAIPARSRIASCPRSRGRARAPLPRWDLWSELTRSGADRVRCRSDFTNIDVPTAVWQATAEDRAALADRLGRVLRRLQRPCVWAAERTVASALPAARRWS